MKINRNSKRQLKLIIKQLKLDESTLWDMVNRRDKTIKELNEELQKITGKSRMISPEISKDEFLTASSLEI